MADENRTSEATGSGGKSTSPPFAERIRAFAAEFDGRFSAYLTPADGVPSALGDALRYSALAPGKRIRPYLVVRCCALVGGRVDDAWPAAAAVECVHAFSLVHDDLPAMDDDDLRRGRPTCHKKFDEAAAILAGDALAVLAFELLGRHVADKSLAGRLVLELAEGAGWEGMIGGQMTDIEGQARPPCIELTRRIHERKTARLMEASCRLGAVTGGGNPETVAACGRYGRALGRAFQISDDLLDVTSTTEVLGKKAGKDARGGKQTFPRCVGIEQSRAALRQAAGDAVAQLVRFGAAADDLRAVAEYVVYRNY